MTWGVPWPRGRLRDVASLALFDEKGPARRLQARPLDHWPDGSIRWTLLDSLLEIGGPGDAERYSIGVSEVASEPAVGASLALEAAEGGRYLTVRTGKAHFHLDLDRAGLFARLEVAGRTAIDPVGTGFFAEDGQGRGYRVGWRGFAVEETGPVRVAVRLDGRFVSPGAEPLLDVVARLHFTAGSATLRVELTLTNRRAAGHPGGRWGLGKAGSVYLRDVTARFALPRSDAPAVARCSLERGLGLETRPAPIELYQDSSGGENWHSGNHANRFGEPSTRFRGYRLRSEGAEETGLRATPLVSVARADAFVALAMREFWQNFPKVIEAKAEGLALGLFPRQSADPHELQGGEQKTHVFHVAFAPDEVSGEPFEWCRSPLVPHALPEWYAACEAVAHLTPRTEDPNSGYLRLVDAAIEGPDRFEAKREGIDEYGWRNFGDQYADHEAAFHTGPEPLISHYNNQYDSVFGFGVHFMRSGDLRWLRLMDELARHVLDIDRYHTQEDKSAFNGGLFWHTDHYIDVGLANHRGHPDGPGVAGAGPSAGHLYSTGLLLYHFLTGNPMARHAVLELGRYVIDADDGSKTIFRFLARGETGHASESGVAYHGPGRAAANSISVLLDAYRLGSDRRYVDKAEQLIRRCIHPRDDLRARELHEPVTRWFYTVFLQSLGKYIDFKVEHGELDQMYAYARAALLHYARWALQHEVPYLERPERLDVPDSSWGAQDMRKSEIFRLAARHVGGEERDRLASRSRFFFDSTVKTLEGMETRSLSRPLALLLSNGYAQAHFDAHPELWRRPPAGSFSFGEPERFVSQKQRAKRRLLGLTLLAAGALAACLVLLGGCR